MTHNLRFAAVAVLIALVGALVQAQTPYVDDLRMRAEAGDAEAQLSLAVGYAVGTVAQLSFEYAEEPNSLVIQMSRDVGILDEDPTPLLRVYGDGLVRIHFPVYMTRAGDYTLQLDPSELQDLVGSFVAGGLIDFSPEATHAQMRGLAAASRAQAAPGQPRQLTFRSDASTVSIEVRLSRYVPPVGVARSDVTARIVWTGVQGDAADFTTLDTLQALAAAERRLLALTERQDATRVPD